jgi:hypothetical protein
MKGKRYADLDSPNGDRHYVLVEWGTKPKKSVSETEAKRISKSDASNLLFMVRE